MSLGLMALGWDVSRFYKQALGRKYIVPPMRIPIKELLV